MTTLTFWGHACVRFDGDEGGLVVDPGSFSDLDAALDGARAVLVTHEHGDHVAVDALVPRLGAGLPLWGPASVVEALVHAGADPEHLHVVRAGDEFRAAGRHVRVMGEWHALIHPDVPLVPNVGYLVDGRVLHPGDSLVPPDVTGVDVLLTPVSGPWLRVADVIELVRALAPRRVVPLHDALLSETGRTLMENLVARLGGAGAPWRLAPGQSLDLDV
ncbi:MBL fold metallo-hydrolase [Cellulomonas soli]|uniref:MBL fold metallo-hydrolase n=1 Tax=Cellulomonas soli TaxID=931535 RepID=UPI003F877482